MLVEPAAIVAGEPDRVTGLRRLYVCLTRAVTSLASHHARAAAAPSWRRVRRVAAPRAGARRQPWPRGPRRSRHPRALLAAADADGCARARGGVRDETRGYHDLRHLAEVCARLEELAAGGAAYDRDAVLLAAWFHDAVYDGERDAEERSAAWAEDALTRPACPADVVARWSGWCG